jgi:hypothetical protein
MSLGFPDLAVVLKAGGDPLSGWGEIAPMLLIASCSALAFVVTGLASDENAICARRRRLVRFQVLA